MNVTASRSGSLRDKAGAAIAAARCGRAKRRELIAQHLVQSGRVLHAECRQRSLNVAAHLIDGVADIDGTWFRGDETVMITAGASAPESVVQECVEFLRRQYGATVEARSIREEQVHFQLPKELRDAAVS